MPLHHSFTSCLFALIPLLGFTSLASANEEVPTIIAPANPPSEWEFSIEPYGWLVGLDGTTAVKGLSTDIDFSSWDLLNHLDWAFFMRGEVRYQKWGLLADGLYAQMQGGGTPPKAYYSNVNLEISQGIFEVELAYRVLEGKWGFLDLYSGIRYNYMGLELIGHTNDENIKAASDQASARIVNDVVDRAKEIVARRVAIRRAELEAKLKVALAERVAARVRDLRGGGLRGLVEDVEIARLVREVADRNADVARAVAESRLAAAGSAARARADRRIAQAEKRLSKALNKRILDRLPTEEEESTQWVDPIIGLRGQVNVTDKIFVAVKGDVGGFGAGSELAWQLTGTVGYQLTESISSEIGYRYYSVDYTQNDFVYDMNQQGLFSGLSIKF